jgi:hypothetical protein
VQDPVAASAAEVDAEAAAIGAVGRGICPLHVVLERAVATAGGTVMACWQLTGGTDVAELRKRLAAALPHASGRQVVQDRAILHTTLARIVSSPRIHAEGSEGDGTGGQGQQGQQQREAAAQEAAVLLQAAVDQMTRQLCGLEATMDQLW